MSLMLLKGMMMIIILLMIAFVTLLERKILGLIQIRKGPNKVLILGYLQPLIDAFKLLSKEFFFFFYINKVYWLISPLLGLLLMLMYWYMLEYNNDLFFLTKYQIVLILMISSLSVYVILISGWSSNSKYSLLGSYRNIAQTISYEVSFSFLIFSILIFSGSYKIYIHKNIQFESMNMFISMMLIMMVWMLVILTEVNRTPFDLSEGESELVSGFNIEYGSILFTLIFMSEYGNILFFSKLSSDLFSSSKVNEIFLMLLFMILLIRGTLIRFRYDKLMMMAWKIILPFSIYLLNLLLMFTFLF